MNDPASFTELVGCELPLQLAGMGGLSTVELAAAVSNAGGLGMIALPTASPDELAAALERVRHATTRPFGVTFIMPFLNPLCVPVAAGLADVVEFSFAAPDGALIEAVHEGNAIAGWQIGDADQARAAVEYGVDYVIVQGNEAGGHHVATSPLTHALAAVVAAVEVPVVAAGGIASQADVQSHLSAGASAVRVGTRFVVAEEADAHPAYAQAVISASAADTTVTTTFDVFWPDTPHRVLTDSVRAVTAETGDVVGHAIADGTEVAILTRSPLLPTSTFVGNVEAAPMYAGSSVDHVIKRQPAAEIVLDLMSQAD